MAYPIPQPAGPDDPVGYSYAALVVRASRDDALRHAEQLRFTGWVGPQEDGWVALVPATPRGRVAKPAAAQETLAIGLARASEAVTLGASVTRDRVLRLVLWEGTRELGRYLSNPAAASPGDDEASPDPEGSEHADAFAAACDRPEIAERLEEVLAEFLDEENEIESERLSRVLALLGLPRWVVAATSLPKDVPGGPAASEFTRLGGGRTGIGGRARGLVTGVAPRGRRKG